MENKALKLNNKLKFRHDFPIFTKFINKDTNRQPNKLTSNIFTRIDCKHKAQILSNKKNYHNENITTKTTTEKDI